MFTHNEFRPLWPVIFFTPWLLLGGAYLLEAVQRWRPRPAVARPEREKLHGPRRYVAGAMAAALLLTGLAASRGAVADPAEADRSCPAASSQQARVVADALYEEGKYQRAGACYDVAGDPLRAQRAFLRAVEPNGEATTRSVSHDSHTAKALFNQVQQAFHSTR